MDQRIEKLRAWGCDVNAAMERMLNDEEFYLECLADIPGDEAFASLQTALEQGDVKAAFDAAHTLKGVLANLGLTPMYQKTVEIVEPLRKGTDQDLMPKFAELTAMKDCLAALLAEA